jgi:tRNA threonylcarbamoyladenosine biosynthesis protein TsaB
MAMPCILAIETSAHVGAVAILRGERCEVVLAAELVRGDPKLSAWVLPAVERVIAAAGLNRTAVDAIAFGAGPGSFTGVRTACATAQSLAFAWQRPLVSVDSLEALADASAATQVCVVLDARMGEVFSASFARRADGDLQRITATTVSKPTAEVVTADAELIGSGAYLLPLKQTFVLAATTHAEAHWAYGVARVAARKLARGETTDPLRAEPIYVRNNVALTEVERKQAREAAA